jgi:3-hydroxybutyryl-CoA dehydrogenase
MMQIDTVAVLGATEDGTTCALLAALAGCAVRVFDGSDAALERAFEVVRRRAELACAAGAITRTERQRVLDGLLFTPDLEEAITGADLAVPATSALAEAERAALAEALRASAAVGAAGGADPATLASCLPHPGRVLALRLIETHGPVPRLEVLPTAATSGHVLERARAFAARVNRAARVSSAPARPAGEGPASTPDRPMEPAA